jgi:mycofactocin precursor
MLNSIPTNNPTNTTEEETSLVEETNEGDIELEELDEELIIEDFTIDGICGVY